MNAPASATAPPRRATGTRRLWIDALWGYLVGIAAPGLTLLLLQLPWLQGGSSDRDAVAFTLVAGAWGCAAGLLRKSLVRALIGVNAAAGLARLLYQPLKECQIAPESIGILLVFGAVMGCVLLATPKALLRTGTRGALVGVVSVFCLGITGWVVIETIEVVTKTLQTDYLGWPVVMRPWGLHGWLARCLRPDYVGWPVMVLGPFGLSQALFNGLLAREESRMAAATISPATPASSPRIPPA